MDSYVCKIATIDEMNTKWDYEIDHAIDGKENWIIWKKDMARQRLKIEFMQQIQIMKQLQKLLFMKYEMGDAKQISI